MFVEINPKVTYRVVRRTIRRPTPNEAPATQSISPSSRTPSPRPSNRLLCDTDSSTRRKRNFDADGDGRLGWYCQCPTHHAHDGILDSLKQKELVCQTHATPVRPSAVPPPTHLQTFRVDSDEDEAPEPCRSPQEPTPAREPRWEGLYHMAATKQLKQRALEVEAQLARKRDEEEQMAACSVHAGKRITQAALERLSTPRRRVPVPEPLSTHKNNPVSPSPQCDAHSWLQGVEEPGPEADVRRSSIGSSHVCLFDDITVEQPATESPSPSQTTPEKGHLSAIINQPSRPTSPGEASWGGLSEGASHK